MRVYSWWRLIDNWRWCLTDFSESGHLSFKEQVLAPSLICNASKQPPMSCVETLSISYVQYTCVSHDFLFFTILCCTKAAQVWWKWHLVQKQSPQTSLNSSFLMFLFVINIIVYIILFTDFLTHLNCKWMEFDLCLIKRETCVIFCSCLNKWLLS